MHSKSTFLQWTKLGFRAPDQQPNLQGLLQIENIGPLVQTAGIIPFSFLLQSFSQPVLRFHVLFNVLLPRAGGTHWINTDVPSVSLLLGPLPGAEASSGHQAGTGN